MPRIAFVEESNIDAEALALIASAERTGAPDPRVVRIMVRSSAGRAWVKCWNSVLYEGRLPHKLKEMCRIRISVAHRCGYCSTVRSNVAKAEGLTEERVHDLLHEGALLSPREKAALEYADLFKSGDEAIDSDAVYARLSSKHVWWAGLRSTLMPGWGQFYSERRTSGYAYLSLGAVAGGVTVAYQIKYNGRIRERNKSYDELQQATTPEEIAAAQADYDKRVIRVDEAKHQRNVALAVFGTVWAVNVVDAILFFRGPHAGGLTVAGVVQPDGDGMAATLALRTRF